MSHFVIEQWKEYSIQVPGKVKYAVSNYGRLKSFTDTIENGKILKGAPTEGFLFLRYARMCNGKKNIILMLFTKWLQSFLFQEKVKTKNMFYILIMIK